MYLSSDLVRFIIFTLCASKFICECGITPSPLLNAWGKKKKKIEPTFCVDAFCVRASPLASYMFQCVSNLCLNPEVRWKGEMKPHYKGEIGSADKSTKRLTKAVCGALRQVGEDANEGWCKESKLNFTGISICRNVSSSGEIFSKRSTYFLFWIFI